MTVPIWAWGVTFAVLAALIAVDLVLTRGPENSLRAAAVESALWLGAALAFGGVLWLWRGPAIGGQYLAGYLLERALSVDNIFVFVVLMVALRVPAEPQRRIIFLGVVGALVLRGVFIAAGGRSMATPLLVALVAIAVTDVVFALDSIPAVFGVTRDLFVVFTSNAFAVLGLRALYFLLAGSADRFVYLKPGIALLLVFIGVKMLLYDVVHMPVWVSLVVIAVVAGGAIGASLWRDRRQRRQRE